MQVDVPLIYSNLIWQPTTHSLLAKEVILGTCFSSDYIRGGKVLKSWSKFKGNCKNDLFHWKKFQFVPGFDASNLPYIDNTAQR